MITPSQVLFSTEAFDSIKTETFAHPDLETGGILIGRRVYYDRKPLLVVLYASGPGQKPARHTLHYAPDHNTLQKYLEEWREHFEPYDVDYIGEWHKHPADTPRPSDGDIRQAQAILKDPDYRLPEGDLLLPITRLVESQFFIGVFYASRLNTNPIELRYEVVAHTTLLKLLNEYVGLKTTAVRIKPEVFVAETDLTEAEREAQPKSQATGRVVKDDKIRYSRKSWEYVEASYKVIDEASKPSPQSATADFETSQSPQGPVHSGVKGEQMRLGRDLQGLDKLAARYRFSWRALPNKLAPDRFEIRFFRPIKLPAALEQGEKVHSLAIELGDNIACVLIQIETDAAWHKIRPIHREFYAIDELVEALMRWLYRKTEPVNPLELGRQVIQFVIDDVAELLKIIETNFSSEAETTTQFEFY